MERIIQTKRPYKHFKGKLYYVHDIIEDTETGELIVSYQALYAPYKMYARPLDMFKSEVDKKNILMQPRNTGLKYIIVINIFRRCII